MSKPPAPSPTPSPSPTMLFPSSCAVEPLHSDSSSTTSLDSNVFFSETAVCSSCVRHLPPFFIINVGGTRHILSQELLSSHPYTRLGRLASCGCNTVLELCDDVDLLENEFFFDRNAQTFQYVMNFYRTGHLHVREGLCEVSFLQEIQYWGLDEIQINSCCRERYYRRKEQKQTQTLDVHSEFKAEEEEEEEFVGAVCPAFRHRLWDFLEKPDSSRAARTFVSLSVFFVVLSVVNMVLSSLDMEEDFGVGSIGALPLVDALEYACVVWFTAELMLRFICVRDKCGFSQRVANIIDLLAILPFYVTLAVESLQGGSSELENMGRVVQVLRLLRSLRMLKLGRHSTGLKSLGLTIAQCYEEVGLLLLFLGVGISIFATAVFALEHNFPSSTFVSVPAAWWWATTSMTTVGYGDIRPDSAAGKVLAFLCILSGILILALPIAIINDRFSACYFTMKMKEAGLRHGEMLKRLARGSVGRAREEGLEGGVNLRDTYARSLLEMMKLQARDRASTRSSGGEELWL